MLVAILVYNGRAFVPACLRSAAGVRIGRRDVDVLVLDDCSPEQGWSQELRALCDSFGLGYYRSPRNLGIPRNMNLALSHAMSDGYDHVFIVNSDVVLPLNLIDAMIRTAELNPGVGSVTAWSNNVSVFSLPNHDTTGMLSRQDMVDWISAELESEFGSLALDLPTGVGFCMLIPVPVAMEVGLFDPVYGRGYCEEVDWCLRSLARGYRAVLAPSTFVFHHGSASTIDAGIKSLGETTVQEHERIVDLRFPSYRDDLSCFDESNVLPLLVERAQRALLLHAAARFGYEIEVSHMQSPPPRDRVRIAVDPDGASGAFSLRFCGFELAVSVADGDVVAAIRRLLGGAPASVALFDRGAFADRLSSAWESTVPVLDHYCYPQRV